MKTPIAVSAAILAFAASLAGAQPDQNPGPGMTFPGRAKPADEKAPYLGVSTAPVTPALGSQLGLPKGIGLTIDYVDPKSPAAGTLQVHDVLHKLNDQLLVDQRQLAILVRSMKAGDKVKLSVFRGGKETTVTVTLAEKDMPPLPEAGWHMPPVQLLPGLFGDDDSPSLFPPFGLNSENLEKRIKDMEDHIKNSGIKPDAIDSIIREMHKKFQPPQFPAPGNTNSVSSRISAGSFSTSTIVKADGEHTITLTRDTLGKTHLSVRTTDGQAVFDGPIDTPEEREKIPEAIRPKVEELQKLDKPDAPHKPHGVPHGPSISL